jgi:hypothetical protein
MPYSSRQQIFYLKFQIVCHFLLTGSPLGPIMKQYSPHFPVSNVCHISEIVVSFNLCSGISSNSLTVSLALSIQRAYAYAFLVSLLFFLIKFHDCNARLFIVRSQRPQYPC